ncbi:MAG TPA: DUF1727 domain-containing protein [Candidatus Caccenecus avistercoris]|nr:DUF1727 domain-containing protein [Candidatus Caccenecus avistercoris]
MKIISIFVGKIFVIIGKLMHRGSSLPGMMALKVDKKFLSKLKYPKTKLIVTGSSGKGSTSSLIADVLIDNGYSICFNNAGSNLKYGVTTACIKNCNLLGKIKKDVLILEVDERYVKEIYQDIKPDYLIVTNITKDQPPRQYHVDIILKEIEHNLPSNTNIIITMDEPYLRNFELDLPNKMLYYSVDKNKYSYKNQLFENLNIYYCPKCGAKLKYDYYNFETLGKYECPKCDFKWIKPKDIATNLDLDKGLIKIDSQILSIGGDMLIHAYNTLAAYTFLKTIGIDSQKIIASINRYNHNKNIEFVKDGKLYKALNCKAENATTYNACVYKTYLDKDLKDIVIGWKEISRRYNHFDVSWLYDVEFELLNNKSLNKIYAVGIDKENIKKRLLLAGIPESKIITADNLSEIKESIEQSKAKKVYGILNFDYMEPFKDTLGGE